MGAELLIGAFVAVIGAVIAGGVSTMNNQKNIEMQQQTNDQTQRNFDRQQGFTEQQWEELKQREDTAHQREVTDLQAAGLSPLASLNGLTAGTVSQPSAPSFVAPQYDMNFITDLARSAMSSIGSASTGLANINDKQRDRDASKADTVLRLDSAEKQLRMKLKSDNSQVNKRLLHESIQFTATLKQQEQVNNREAALEIQKSALADLDRLTGGNGSNIRYYEYDQYEEYLEARTRWNTAYTIFLDTNIDSLGARRTESASEGGSAQGSSGFRLPGLGGSVNATVNASESSTEQKDYTLEFSAMMKRFIDNHPFPYLKPKSFKGKGW